MTDKAAYNLGWDAAANGESRKWCEQYGFHCVWGYDAYWEMYGPD